VYRYPKWRCPQSPDQFAQDVSETVVVFVLRRPTPADTAFLRDMLAVAADWRPDAPQRSVAKIMRDPALAHYLTGWQSDRDAGFIAEDERPLGAAWWRFFTANHPGYGFINEATPEVSIGVCEEARGQGLGTLLLETLVAEARLLRLPALSLSVEPDNPASRLYERLGFVAVDRLGGAVTMVLSLA
jgi:GNAT superfamily N-acetyltransferase